MNVAKFKIANAKRNLHMRTSMRYASVGVHGSSGGMPPSTNEMAANPGQGVTGAGSGVPQLDFWWPTCVECSWNKGGHTHFGTGTAARFSAAGYSTWWGIAESSESTSQLLYPQYKPSLQSAIHLLVKAFSWRAVSESCEKFQPTTSRKNLDSVLSSCTGSSVA